MPDLQDPLLVAIHANDRAEAVQSYLTLLTSMNALAFVVWFCIGFEGEMEQALFRRSLLFSSRGFFPEIYYVCGGKDLDPILCVVVICFGSGLGFAFAPDLMYLYKDLGNDKIAGMTALEKRDEELGIFKKMKDGERRGLFDLGIGFHCLSSLCSG